MATATLVTLVLLFIVSTIVTVMAIQTLISVMEGYGGYDETTGTFSDDTLNSVMDGYDETTGTFSDDTSVPNASDLTSVNVIMLLILPIIVFVLNVLALIFSGIFTWGRKCCGAPRA
jgi:ABC-type transport system involved in multi-copper enzyme maturation permease subunit